MFRLNSWQLLLTVTAILFLGMAAERAYIALTSSYTIAYRVPCRDGPCLTYTWEGESHSFSPNEFTTATIAYDQPIEVGFNASGEHHTFVNTFSGLCGKQLFYFCIITFGWLMCGSAILAHNEQLLIGKGWLKSRKTKAADASGHLPAVRKKSRNFKND